VKCSLHFHYILSATHPEAQKPPNHKAIPILIKNTQYSDRLDKSPVTLKDKSYPIIKRSLFLQKLHKVSDRSLPKPNHSEVQKLTRDLCCNYAKQLIDFETSIEHWVD
jgi:hypothetical protein